MGIFRNHYISTYNFEIGTRLLNNCKCYSMYKNENDFIENIIKKQRSYMGCLCYQSSKSKQAVDHASVPIMVGSFLDYVIRGPDVVDRDKSYWGSFILKGTFQIYIIFSTFDALSLHVSVSNKEKSINLFTYSDGHSLALKYLNNIVHYEYQAIKYNSITNPSNEWVDLLNKANKYTTEPINAIDYLTLFNLMLSKDYNMNLLAHRQFLSGVQAMKKYINFFLNQKRKKKQCNITLSDAFEKGCIFAAFSKPNICETKEQFNHSTKTFNFILHDGKSDKAEQFMATVSRVTNLAIRNSKALMFPSDGLGYLCLLNTKDMKSAGEQHVLVDDVIMSSDTDDILVYQYLKKNYHKSINDGPNIIVLNSNLIHCRINMASIELLVKLKKQFPHITTKYEYLPYIFISTKNSILMKYSQKYDCYFSPSETTYFQIQPSEYGLLSLSAKLIGQENFRRNQPPKSTVSINNLKGSIATLQSSFHKVMMENSLGHSVYIEMDDAKRKTILDSAILETNCDTSNFLKIFNTEIEPLLNLSTNKIEVAEQDSNDLFEQKLRHSAIFLYNEFFPKLLWKNDLENKNTYLQRFDKSNDFVILIQNYLKLLYSKEKFSALHKSNLTLYCAFGNEEGKTMEDGMVMDGDTMNFLKKYPINYNACITISFCFKNIAQPKQTKFISITGNIGNYTDTLVGCLISPNEIQKIKNSTHCFVNCQKIGSHYYYLIHFSPNQHQIYSKLNIRYIINKSKLIFVINGIHQAQIGIGTKFANNSGQKNICSTPSNLKRYWGITRDGRKIFAQILYSEVSILGRTPAGQLMQMLKSPDLALGPNGEIIAPVDLLIHTLHPYTNNKIFDLKVDTLTNINGFDSQNLSNTSSALRDKQSVRPIAINLLNFLGYEIEFSNNIDADIRTLNIQTTNIRKRTTSAVESLFCKRKKN